MKRKTLTLLLLIIVTSSIIGTSSVIAIKPSEPQPNNIHGPGYGFYNSPEGRWEGEVWAHYDENGNPDDPQGIWEVGVEGTPEIWYTMGFVDFEKYNGNILIAKGTFEDVEEWPLAGREFVYIANLRTMKWILNGEGFHFKGTIEVINAYD
jgi:hypothetical protein